MSLVTAPLSDLRSTLQAHAPHDGLYTFICSASFETRSRSIADHLSPSDCREVFVAENRNHRQLHSQTAAYLTQRFSPQSRLVDLDTTRPLVSGDALRAVVESCASDPANHVLVDITAFTHEALLILVGLLARTLSLRNVTFLYARAADYSTNEPPETKWLSKGVGEVRSVLGFPGAVGPTRKLHLIVLAGFEDDRAGELIRSCEPSVVSLGRAQSSNADSVTDSLAQLRFHKLLGRWSDAREFTFPAYDPSATEAIVRSQIDVLPDHDTVIACMNTKLSTVGAALVALKDEGIQLCYAQALLYNHRHYSTPGPDFFLFRAEG